MKMFYTKINIMYYQYILLLHFTAFLLRLLLRFYCVFTAFLLRLLLRLLLRFYCVYARMFHVELMYPSTSTAVVCELLCAEIA